MMDEPAGPSDAWSNVSTGAEGISPIHRPTSAPPVMELAQQLNAAELAQQGFLPMDPAYFGVSSEASNARDASGAFFGEHGHPLYLNGNGNQDDFMAGTHSEASRGPTGPAENYGPSAGAHLPYPQHMMPGAHSHMSHFAMHQGGPQAMNMASNGMPYFGMPNPAHMAGYHGPMPQAYGFQGYVPGPAANNAAHVPPEMVYRQGGPTGYFGYSHFQTPESHMYGYAGPVAPNSAQQPGRAHSVGGEDNAKTVPYGMHGVPRAGYNYSHNMGLSASPPSEGMNWNKSSPRGGKRVGGKGKSSTEVSLSSSTEDLLSLAGKPHLIKDLGPSGSMEFSGSLAELPIMGSPSPSPHSPRSPQAARKHIKVQQRSANGNFKSAPGTGNGNDANTHVGGATRASSNANNSANGSHPMPIGWSAAGNANGDEISGLFAGVTLSGSSGPSPASAIPINSTVVHPEFVMGSGSPILARMHHPAAANGNAAPGSNAVSNSQVCHYHTMGLCGKGDKCRYTHSEDGNSGRRTPRAPVVSPVSFGSESSPANAANGAMHIQQAVPANHHAMAMNGGAPLILSQSPSANMTSVPTSSIGQAPLLAPMNSLLGGSGLVGASNGVGNGAASGAVGGQATAAATGASGNNATNTQALASMRYSNVTLEECVGQIFQMCKDQYGCRFLQKKLDEDKTSMTCDIIFGEILPEVVELMSDPFGNYLCQKLIEKCTASQRLAIVRGVSGSLVQISKNMHGTRAVQKTIEQLGSPEEVRLIREALKGSVVALIQDLNGNHVIQKCIHRLEPNDNQFIYDAVAHHCVQVATHRHGCCVMQRCIDHSSNQQKMQLIEEIKNNALSLVQDQFGNYVVQYVLDLGMESVCESLATNLLGHLYFLSTQKFSSNVVEKCLKVGNAATVQMMSRELAEFQTDPAHPVFPQTPNEDPLICLLQHPFGNYVVQTALQVAQIKASKEWNLIAARIRPLLPTLRSNTYVKRVQGLLLQANAKMAAEGGVDGQNLIPNDDSSLATSPLSLSNEQLTDMSQLPNAHNPNSANANQPNLIQQNGHAHGHPQHHHNNHHNAHHHHHGPRSHGPNRAQGGGRHGKEHNNRSSYEQRRQH